MIYSPEIRSGKTDWETPQPFFDYLNSIYHFNQDVCANEFNYKMKPYFTIKDDALKQEWKGTCFMNPPYGYEIYWWIKKAYDEGRKGNKIVCLLPSRTDNSWFHEFVMRASEIIFIRGRIRFSNSKLSPQFGSIIVIFEKTTNKFPNISNLELNDLPMTHSNTPSTKDNHT